MAESLRFAPSILARLGEELVPHPDQGIIELAKNAYDADARTCRVALHDVIQPGGTVAVSDDGDGMTVQQIRAGLACSRALRERPVSENKIGSTARWAERPRPPRCAEAWAEGGLGDETGG